MNNEEARFILSAYRPGGQDANDPDFASALAQAQRDPTLKAWFEAEQSFDAAVAERLHTVRPPADLRAAILVGAKASEPVGWKMPSWAMMAAMVALCIGLLGLWMTNRQTPTPAFADWQETAFRFLESAPKLDRMSPQADELQEWLRAANSPTPPVLPASLAKLKALGCKTLESDGHRISVLCFHRGNGKLIHLVVSDRSAAPGLPTADPVFAQRGDWTTASWAQGDEAYMLVTEGKPVDLAQYL
jgi:hypothetical protein